MPLAAHPEGFFLFRSVLVVTNLRAILCTSNEFIFFVFFGPLTPIPVVLYAFSMFLVVHVGGF